MIKIAVAFPSGDTVKAQFTTSLIRLRSRGENFEVVNILNVESCRIAFNRNYLVREALKTAATHILFIDADIIVPPDALEKLVAHNLDIVGVTASKRGNDDDAIGVTLDGERLKIPSPPTRMRLLGLPFTLINLDVFRNLPEPWFAEPPRNLMGERDSKELMAEDEYFCQLAIQHGYDVYCDINLSMEIGHRGCQTFRIMNPTVI